MSGSVRVSEAIQSFYKTSIFQVSYIFKFDFFFSRLKRSETVDFLFGELLNLATGNPANVVKQAPSSLAENHLLVWEVRNPPEPVIIWNPADLTRWQFFFFPLAPDLDSSN